MVTVNEVIDNGTYKQVHFIQKLNDFELKSGKKALQYWGNYPPSSTFEKGDEFTGVMLVQEHSDAPFYIKKDGTPQDPFIDSNGLNRGYYVTKLVNKV
jgi:hypothetical protein